MRMHRSNPLHVSRLRPLVACLAVAFSAEIFAGSGVDNHALAPSHPSDAWGGSQSKSPIKSPIAPSQLRAVHGAQAKNDGPHQPNAPQTWTVLNCHDGGTDSLRDVITNHALPGDTIDLSMLPNLCGMTDSVITLHSGEIEVYQGDLTLRGPKQGTGTVTISGYNLFRVFEHTGSGTLSLYSLTIADGHYDTAGLAQGGCIRSNPGGLYLNKTIVSNCTLSSSAGVAAGGAIYSHGTAKLVLSTISGSEVSSPLGTSLGGGVHATGDLYLSYSSIKDNVAHENALYASIGGA